MKNRLFANIAILSLALAGTLSISAVAQTTDEGTGPSEQPSSPMEMGQGAGGPQAQMGEDQGDAQPTEAQPGGPEGEEPAKTDQGVARVSMIHGDVSTQRGDSGDWSAATLNQPVMGGDKVSTGDNARTELQLDFANVFRLGANAKANIVTLTQKTIQIQLGQGLATFSTSKDSDAEPEIDTPNVSLHPAHHDGVFRIEVRPDGDTIVIVRQGEAQISTPQGSTEIHTGDMATIRGNADSAQYKISQAPDRDDWDRWNSDRDHLIHNAQSWKHTNRYYTGAQDLDAYGQWQNVQDYGDVWVPNESDDWAPYRNGNWTYEPYYGWTWVGYEPWGWAPYHYGRWFSYGGRWAWWPGPGGFYRPFWSPAYVSFYGWGGGFGFGFGWGGWGGFGWLPIGPCDWFHPWWGGYRGRFGVVGYRGGFNRWGGFRPLHGGNRYSNIANIHNSHIARGLSTVNAGHFGTGRVTAMPASRAQLNGARMMAGNLPVVPTRASLSASGRAASPGTIHNGGSERFFGTHNNMARPVTFQHETNSLRSTMQQSHINGFNAGGRTEASSRGGFNSTMQRPSAGLPRTGEMSSSPRGNAGIGTSTRESGNSGTRSGNPGGFRTFTPPSNSTRSESPVASPRTGMGSENNMGPTRGNESPRGGVQSNPGSSRDGFRPFTPPSHSAAPGGSQPGGFQGRAPESRGSEGSYWNRTAPSSQSGSQMHMNGPVYGGSERGSSRPQLDMRQPIVRGGNNGGYRGTPSYGGVPRSAPSYGGGRSAPSYGGGGGHVSAPSGGGHVSGGGGGHVSSGGGGGSHSGGGGGGSHSGGGHH